MKLHLPPTLRTALIACFSLLTPLSLSTSTGTLATGLVLYTLSASSSQAADITLSDSSGSIFVLSDGSDLGDGTFANDDNLTVEGEGTTTLQINGEVDITDLTLGASKYLIFNQFTAGNSLSIDTITMGDSSTVYFDDASLLTLSGTAKAVTGDVTTTVVFDGTNQNYDIGSAFSTYSGTIHLTEGNTLTVTAMTSSSITLDFDAGSYLVKTGSDAWIISHYTKTRVTDYDGAYLIIEEGSVEIRQLTRAAGDIDQAFANITIEASGTFIWGASNSTGTSADVTTFNGGVMTTSASNTTTFDYFEVTDNGGSFTITGSANTFTINTLTMAAGATEATYTIDRSHYENVTTMTIGEVLNYNGTIAVTGAFSDLTTDYISHLYISSVNNATGYTTSFEGVVNVASTGMSITGGANFNYLVLEDSSVLTVNSGATVGLTGTITMGADSTIANEGTITFAETVSFDLSGMTWTTEDSVTYTLQILTGSGESNFDTLDVTNLLNADENLAYTFNSDGSISYTMGSLVFEGTSLDLYAGAQGFSDETASFVDGDSITFDNTATSLDSPITVTVGLAELLADVSVGQLKISDDTHVSVSLAEGFEYDFAVASISLGINATLSMDSYVANFATITSTDDSALIIFNSPDSVIYYMGYTDLTEYYGSFILSAGNQLYVGGDFANQLTVMPGDTYDTATYLRASSSATLTTIQSDLIFGASSEEVESGYVILNAVSGYELCLAGTTTITESTYFEKSGAGTLTLSGTIVNGESSSLTISNGTVNVASNDSTMDKIVVQSGTILSVTGSSVDWDKIANTIVLEGGTFSDTSGGSASVFTTAMTIEVAASGSSAIDMSASLVTMTEIYAIQGQSDTDDYDGDLTITGNALMEGQQVTLLNINNLNGTIYEGSDIKLYVSNITNTAEDTTVLRGTFYTTGGTIDAAGSVQFADKLVLEGNLVSNQNLTVSSLEFANASTSLSNAGSLSLTGIITLAGENQLINTGSVDFSLDGITDTVVFDLSNITLSEGTYQIFDITTGDAVDLSGLSAVDNLILSTDNPFLRAEFNSTGGLTLTSVDGEKLFYLYSDDIALSTEDGFLDALYHNASFSSYDSIIFNALDELASTTLTVDVANAEISLLSLESNRDLSINAVEAVSIYSILIGENSSLTLLDNNVDFVSISNTDDTAVLNFGTAESAVDYSVTAALSNYTGTINLLDNSSLTISSSSSFSSLNMSSGTTLTLNSSFGTDSVITSTDSTALVVLDGEEFNAGSTVFAGYTGSITLESGHLIAENMRYMDTLTLNAGTAFTWTETSTINSDSLTIEIVAYGGDTYEEATVFNFDTSFNLQYSSSHPARITFTGGEYIINTLSGVTFNNRGVDWGSEGDVTISKTGAGSWILNCLSTTFNAESSVDLNIYEGSVQINQSSDSSANGFAFENIYIGEDTYFYWSNANNGTSSPTTVTGTITLDGGTYYNTYVSSYADTTDMTTTIYHLDVTAKGGAFYLNQKRSYIVEELTGEAGAVLNISGSSSADTDITFTTVNDFNGTISNQLATEGSYVTLGNVVTSDTTSTLFEGSYQTSGLVKTGAGSASIDTLAFSFGANITVEEGSLAIGSVDFGYGSITLGSSTTAGALSVVDSISISNNISVLGSGSSLSSAGTLTLTGTITFGADSGYSLDMANSLLSTDSSINFVVTDLDASTLDSIILLTGLSNEDTILTSNLNLTGSNGLTEVESWVIENGNLIAILTTGEEWTGAATDSNWSSGSNWSGGTAPAADSTVTIGDDGVAGTSITLDATIDLAGIKFTGSENWTLNDDGNTATTISMGAITQNGTGNVTLNFTLDADDSITVNSGTVTLATAQSVQGDVSISGGSLVIQGGSSISSLSATSGNLTVGDGGTTSVTTTTGASLTSLINGTGSLSISGITVTGDTTNSGTLSLTDSTIASVSGGSLVMAGTSSIATLNAVTSLNNSGSLNVTTVGSFTGSVTNSGTLTFENIASLGTVNNTGTLNVIAGSSISNLTGGTLSITGTGNTSVTTSGSLAGFSNSSTGTVTFTDVAFGSAVSAGGDVSANNITLAAGSTNVFGIVNTTGTISYGNSGSTKGSLTFESGSSINAIVITNDGSADAVASQLKISTGTGDTAIGSVTGEIYNFNNSSTGILTVGSGLSIVGTNASSSGTLILKDSSGAYGDLSITNASATISLSTIEVGNVSVNATTMSINAGSSIKGTFSDSSNASKASITISALATDDAASVTSIDAIASDALNKLSFNSTGTLIINSSLTTAGAVTNAGTLNIQAGGTIASLTGSSGTLILSGTGDTTISELSTSIAGLENTSAGTLSIGSSATIDSFVNTGSISVAGELSLTDVTAQGGSITADSLVLVGGDEAEAVTGSNSFDAITITGDSLSMGGVLDVSGALTLGTAGVTDVFTITITDFTKANDSVSTSLDVGSLTVNANSLNFAMDESVISDLGLGSNATYTILSSDTDFADIDLLINGSDSTAGSVAGYTITIDSEDSTKIVLSCVLSGNEFTNDAGTGSWSNALNWADGEVPDASTIAYLTGENGINIILDGSDALVAQALLVDMNDDGTGVTPYTLSTEAGADKDLTVGDVIISGSGALVLEDGVTLVVDSSTAEGSTGKLILGTSELASSEVALLQLNEGSALITEDLTLNSDYSETSGLNNIAGIVTVSGTLEGTGKTIYNGGSLNIGGSATLANIEGTGTTTIEEGASLTLANSSNSLSVGSAIGNSFVNSGTLYLQSSDESTVFTLTLGEGDNALGAVVTEALTVQADSSASTANAAFTGLSATELNIVDGASASFAGSNTVSSITGAFSIAEGGSLTVSDDVTLSDFSSDGLLDLTGHSLIVESSVTELGSVKATDMSLSTALTYDTLTTDSITLTSISTDAFALSGDEITALSGGKIELVLTELDKDIAVGSYKIIDSTDTDLVWSDFSLVGTDALYDILTNDKTITYLQENGELSLVIGDATGLTWDTAQTYVPGAEDTDTTIYERLDIIDANGQLASADILDNVDNINVTTDTTIDLSAGSTNYDITMNNLISASGTTLTLTGDGVASDSATLNYNSGVAVVNGTIDANGVALNIVSAEGSSLSIADVDLTDASLTLASGANATIAELELENSTFTGESTSSVGSLIGDETSTLAGTVNITGGDEDSIYSGSYAEDSIINLAGGSAQIALVAEENLSLTGTAGTASITGASSATISSIATTGASVSLGDLTSSLTVTDGVSMEGGSLSLNIDASNDSIVNIFADSDVSLTDVTIVIGQIEGTEMPTGDSATDNVLLQVTTGDLTLSGVNEVVFSDDLAKYYINGQLNANGTITADRNTDIYTTLTSSTNGNAGAILLNAAFVNLDPQTTLVPQEDPDADPEYVYKDLKMVMDELDTYLSAGTSSATADALAAAVAGSTTTSLGSAMMSDVERQLRSIRNRAKNMGVNPAVVNTDMPYINGWMSAEGANSELDSDKTAAGHSLNNYGGSVGASFTALYGDLESNTAYDRAEGDFDTMYGSIYARINDKRWTHSIVATFGSLDASLDRTVTAGTGSYKTKGDTDGYGVGLMYEVGYTYALNENATTCLQPIFNMSLVRSSISGYEESLSDAALKVGEQENTYVTVGMGGLLETVVGENLYNRASILSARAMLKFDLGDRASEADVSLVNNQGYTETIKGAEAGAVGVEFGLGLTIPVTEYTGAIFMDASVEVRDGMNSVNGSVGYRFEF